MEARTGLPQASGLGFIGFIGLIGLIRLVGLIGLISFVGFKRFTGTGLVGLKGFIGSRAYTSIAILRTSGQSFCAAPSYWHISHSLNASNGVISELYYRGLL